MPTVNRKAGSTEKSFSDYIKEMGSSNTISYTILTTKPDGTVDQKEGGIAGSTCFNELLAFLLWAEALQGDQRSRKELLDRIEEKKSTATSVEARQVIPITEINITDETNP